MPDSGRASNLPQPSQAVVRHEQFKVARGLLLSLIVGVLLIVVLVETVIILRINERSITNHEILKQLNEGKRFIVNCTTPGRQCFIHGKDVTALIVYCGQQNFTLPDIESCVTNHLH